MSDASVPVAEEIRVMVPSELKRSFEAAAKRSGEPVEGVLVELMRSYVEGVVEPEEGYDEWARAKIEGALQYAGPLIPHDEVVRRSEERAARFLAHKKSA